MIPSVRDQQNWLLRNPLHNAVDMLASVTDANIPFDAEIMTSLEGALTKLQQVIECQRRLQAIKQASHAMRGPGWEPEAKQE